MLKKKHESAHFTNVVTMHVSVSALTTECGTMTISTILQMMSDVLKDAVSLELCFRQ